MLHVIYGKRLKDCINIKRTHEMTSVEKTKEFLREQSCKDLSTEKK